MATLSHFFPGTLTNLDKSGPFSPCLHCLCVYCLLWWDWYWWAKGLYGDQLSLPARKLSNIEPAKTNWKVSLSDGEKARERKRERERETVCKNMFPKLNCKEFVHGMCWSSGTQTKMRWISISVWQHLCRTQPDHSRSAGWSNNVGTSSLHFLIFFGLYLQPRGWIFNGNSRILKWRYCTI